MRNPWDRLVSAFFYLDRGGSNSFDKALREEKLARYGGEFDSFVRDLPLLVNEKFFRPAVFWLGSSEDDSILVDRVLRYENLADEITALFERLGITSPELGNVNSTIHPHYRDCYSADTREIVREAYAADIRQFGYEF